MSLHVTLDESLKRAGGSLISRGILRKLHLIASQPTEKKPHWPGIQTPRLSPTLLHRAVLPTQLPQKLQVQLRANHSWQGVGWDTKTLKRDLRSTGGTLMCHYWGGQDSLGKVRRGDGQVPCAEELQSHSLPD